MLLGSIAAISAVLAAVITFFCGGFSDLSRIWILPVTFLGFLLLQALAVFLYLLYLCKRWIRASRRKRTIPTTGK